MKRRRRGVHGTPGQQPSAGAQNGGTTEKGKEISGELQIQKESELYFLELDGRKGDSSGKCYWPLTGRFAINY